MILAIDQGTTGTTCLVVDEGLCPIGRGYRALEQHFPQPAKQHRLIPGHALQRMTFAESLVFLPVLRQDGLRAGYSAEVVGAV